MAFKSQIYTFFISLCVCSYALAQPAWFQEINPDIPLALTQTAYQESYELEVKLATLKQLKAKNLSQDYLSSHKKSSFELLNSCGLIEVNINPTLKNTTYLISERHFSDVFPSTTEPIRQLILQNRYSSLSGYVLLELAKTSNSAFGTSPVLKTKISEIPERISYSIFADTEQLAALTGVLDVKSSVTGSSLAHWAAYANNVVVLKLIYATKPESLTIQNNAGATPLMFALQHQSNQETIAFLLQHSDLTQVDNNNSNILHYAALYCSSPSLKFLLSQLAKPQLLFLLNQVDAYEQKPIQKPLRLLSPTLEFQKSKIPPQWLPNYENYNLLSTYTKLAGN